MLNSGESIEENGIRINVNEGGGSIVLKLDDTITN